MKTKTQSKTKARTKAGLIDANGSDALRAILAKACAKTGSRQSDLTVLSAAVDPYRLDTDAGHRDARWVAEQLDRLVAPEKKIHWRGLHYLLISTTGLIKPNGQPYLNSDKDWTWLSEGAGKAARWLGYIPFEKITDNRNADPVIFRKAHIAPKRAIAVGFEIKIPDVDDLAPTPVAEGFVPRQAFNFVIFGEKASLESVLLPIARAKQADLYLPTGEISDTLLYRIAKDAAEDDRPLVLLTVSDCDPAGYQMPVSIGRKLQAFRDLLFPQLKFEVVPVALTPEQVRELDLPSTPLKEGEKRAGPWVEAFGIEQTEIDALLVLRPDAFREMVENAFAPYFDDTLADRVDAAKTAWMGQAQQAINAQTDPIVLAAVREDAVERLAELDVAIADINERLRVATDGFDLPEIVVPQPEITEDAERHALVSFKDNWVAATRALIARKRYGNGNGE